MDKRDGDVGVDSLADVIERLGGVPLHRVRVNPPIGKATEKHLMAARDPLAKLLELVDGILVEKAVTFAGAILATEISRRLGNHVEGRKAGVLLGASCPFLLKPGLVRKANVAFVPWKRIPGRKIDMNEYFAKFPPELVVELLAPDTPAAELARRLNEYFAAGTRLAWVIDPLTETARSYTSPEKFDLVSEAGQLNGDPVLPKLSFPLAELFRHFHRSRTG